VTPILYSFRRCPYAIRARLALLQSGTRVELREVVLRDKPEAFLAISPSATVPCLATTDGVIDESIDIMHWALGHHDPQQWLDMPEAGEQWIARCDGPFKHALDRTKYVTRYPDEDANAHRADAYAFLAELNETLSPWIFERPTLADYAILPFVRQFAFIDKPLFNSQPWPNLHHWLETFLTSAELGQIMQKYPQWHEGDAPTYFPPQN
jgi:glutathione S-transferase